MMARSPKLRRRAGVAERVRAETEPRRIVALPDLGQELDTPSAFFQKDDGAVLPIYDTHRYRLTKGPTYIAELACLYELERFGILNSADRATFRQIVGTRTLTIDVAEARRQARAIAEKYRDHLVEGGNGLSSPVASPDDRTLHERVEECVTSLRYVLERARFFAGQTLRDEACALEIGFTSGGYSAFAFERMGFKATAIDNAYDGIQSRPHLHTHLAKRLGSNTCFQFGDISKRTSFANGSFDLISSVSVIEHLADIPGAMEELRRLLKPDGFLLQRYNPFFSANGGHSWGELDCPWGHIRVTESEHIRYLNEKRPNEAAEAGKWVRGTLNRAATLGQVQRWVSEAGFRIVLWEEWPEPLEEVRLLDKVAIDQAFCAYPTATLNDLLTREVIFIAVPA